jgi:hypothetical protein
MISSRNENCYLTRKEKKNDHKKTHMSWWSGSSSKSCWPSKHKAMSSRPSAAKKKKKITRKEIRCPEWKPWETSYPNL